MAKKDFTQVDSVIAQVTAPQGAKKPRKEYTEQEAREIAETMQTTGRKGVKMPRINLAFRPAVYDYIVTMARVRGETLTEFCNLVLSEHMEQHRELYEKAIEFRNSL